MRRTIPLHRAARRASLLALVLAVATVAQPLTPSAHTAAVHTTRLQPRRESPAGKAHSSGAARAGHLDADRRAELSALLVQLQAGGTFSIEEADILLDF